MAMVSAPRASIVAAEAQFSGARTVSFCVYSRSRWIIRSEDGAVDLVITDMLMPEKDGIEVMRELGSTANPPPVLAISGGGMTGGRTYLDLAAALGAADTLAKPFTSEKLLAKVSMLLKHAAK